MAATGTLNSVKVPGTITIVSESSGKFQPGDLIDFKALPPNAKVDDDVTFDIDDSGLKPLAINIVIVDPPEDNYPYNNEFPGATIINTPLTQNLSIDGTTTIIDGTTLTGDITVINGGTIVIKTASPESTTQAVVTGTITAKDNTTVIIYDSVVGKNVIVDNATELRITKKGGVKGNTEVARTAKVRIKGGVKGNTEVQRSGHVRIKGGGLKGNTEFTSNKHLSIIDATIAGNVNVSLTKKSTVITNLTSTSGNIVIDGNTGCSYTNITAPTGTVTINGCNPA